MKNLIRILILLASFNVFATEADDHVAEGRRYLAQGNENAARIEFKAALRLEPGHQEATQLLRALQPDTFVASALYALLNRLFNRPVLTHEAFVQSYAAAAAPAAGDDNDGGLGGGFDGHDQLDDQGGGAAQAPAADAAAAPNDADDHLPAVGAAQAQAPAAAAAAPVPPSPLEHFLATLPMYNDKSAAARRVLIDMINTELAKAGHQVQIVALAERGPRGQLIFQAIILSEDVTAVDNALAARINGMLPRIPAKPAVPAKKPRDHDGDGDGGGGAGDRPKPPRRGGGAGGGAAAAPDMHPAAR